MAKMLGFRLLRLIATLFAVSVLTFLMTSLLPGDPVNSILPPEAPRTPEIIERIRADLNLDDSLPQRYISWLGNTLQGDLGESYVTDEPVLDTIKARLPITFELAILATLIALLLAVPLGTLGAYREGRPADKLSSAFVQIALSIPNFILGIFLIWFFTVKNQWLPSTGWNRISEDGLLQNLKTAILPATALAMAPMAIYARLVRSDMVGTLKENYVLSARAKGLSDRYILRRHALRPSSLSLVTVVGLQFGALLGGTVIIEQIFALPGLGSKLLQGILGRDILVVQGITVFIATSYVLINTLVDLLYMAIDPRIKKA